MLLCRPRPSCRKRSRCPRHGLRARHLRQHARHKMEQARNALKFCLEISNPNDRFGMMNFATTVNKYTRNAARGHEGAAFRRRRSGSMRLEATGGTAIDDALSAALGMRASDEARPSPSSSSPTASRPSAKPIATRSIKNVAEKNTARHAHLHLRRRRRRQRRAARRPADKTRAISTLCAPNRGHRGQGQRACTARSAIRC